MSDGAIKLCLLLRLFLPARWRFFLSGAASDNCESLDGPAAPVAFDFGAAIESEPATLDKSGRDVMSRVFPALSRVVVPWRFDLTRRSKRMEVWIMHPLEGEKARVGGSGRKALPRQYRPAYDVPGLWPVPYMRYIRSMAHSHLPYTCSPSMLSDCIQQLSIVMV